MSLSSIAVNYRHKQAKAQRAYLRYSLIASIALHTTVLVFVGNIWSEPPKIKDKPIEFTIVTKNAEPIKPPQGKKAQSKSNSGSSGSGDKTPNKLPTAAGGNSAGNTSVVKHHQVQNSPKQRVYTLKKSPQQPLQVTKPSKPVTKITQQKVERTQPRVVVQNLPSQKLIDTIEQPPVQQVLTKPVDTQTPQVVDASIPPVQKVPIEKHIQTQTIAPSIERVKPHQGNASLIHKLIERRNISSHTETSKVFTPAPSTSITANTYPPNQLQDSEKLSTNVTKSTGSSLGEGNGGHGNGVNGNGGHGDSMGDGNGTGNGNSGSGNGAGNGNENGVVTDPKPLVATNSRLNPADCDRCIIEYPDSARRRHIEGSPEVAIDHDENGKVTNVRLVRSSGSVELDEALLEQARNFKLKPNIGGRKGVRVTADFAVKGSQRHKQRQAKQKQSSASPTPTNER
ncbi:TonB family protein [Aetokthonos hydrillicola Thurmond2011]|jgi:TonB family protein|uniref:TonB family protein n=1 Tax=Aetokthonos hydrillicola Thurmond2011 TaxID=2712845 RepID=A0AAP5M9M1_9CYAN|nr:energy transducer TonB [Aetokthonos hydrillicola]MDR9894843.1 TonB family protein [Aetokthonos hydrillicola Thurmond2011]